MTTTTDHTDLGPMPAAPHWCEPDAEPIWEGSGDTATRTWIRALGDDWLRLQGGVLIECEDQVVDGRLVRGASSINCPHIHGLMSAEQARQLGAALIAAADLIEAAGR